MVSRPIYLVMTIVIPLVVVLFFATFLNKGVPTQMPIAVIDFDNSSSSRQIVRTISSGQFCKVKYKLSSYEVAQARMQREDIYAFIIIPRDFQKNVVNGNQPEVVFCTEYVNERTYHHAEYNVGRSELEIETCKRGRPEPGNGSNTTDKDRHSHYRQPDFELFLLPVFYNNAGYYISDVSCLYYICGRHRDKTRNIETMVGNGG